MHNKNNAYYAQTITRAEGVAGEEAGHDLELDESHLDLLEGSELHILDDGDLEVEDAGSLWLSGQSKVVAAQSSNIQTQLAHVLVEGGSSISIQSNSSWMVTQEFDFTPAQGALQQDGVVLLSCWCCQVSGLRVHNSDTCSNKYALVFDAELHGLLVLPDAAVHN